MSMLGKKKYLKERLPAEGCTAVAEGCTAVAFGCTAVAEGCEILTILFQKLFVFSCLL